MKVLITGGTGYIGSALHHYLRNYSHTIDTVDSGVRGTHSNPNNYKIGYKFLAAGFMDRYDAIIHLAGHSSVTAAKEDPSGAFDNNVASFHQLLQNLSGQPLIYASSSSVYSIADSNMYDFSKATCDTLADFLYPNHYALRFGTVCGCSPNMRWDLMINSMVKSGMETGTISVRNQGVRRPVLGIWDLCRSVERLLTRPHTPGVYNLASFTLTVGEIAALVAETGGWDLTTQPDTPTYDFEMPTVHRIWPYLDTVEKITQRLIKTCF
jgi:UDP-glucose 4-epimerase